MWSVGICLLSKHYDHAYNWLTIEDVNQRPTMIIGYRQKSKALKVAGIVVPTRPPAPRIRSLIEIGQASPAEIAQDREYQRRLAAWVKEFESLAHSWIGSSR